MFWFLLGLSLALESIFYVSWAQTSAFAYSSAIFLTVLALAWVLSHAKENNVQTPMALHVAVVALSFIAVPYYRFRYFGFKDGFRFLCWLVLALVGVIVALDGLDYFVNGTTAAY
jgi:hypothetical protein